MAVAFHGGITVTQGSTNVATPKLLLLTGGAVTGQGAGTDTPVFDVNIGTITWSTGALATQRFCLFRAPTIAFSGTSTATDSATVVIAGAPAAGALATLTRAYALWCQAGGVRFDGTTFGVFGVAPVVQQTAALPTNSVTAGGTTDVYADFTGAVYTTDAAAIRNDLYQHGQKIIQMNTALRNLGFLA